MIDVVEPIADRPYALIFGDGADADAVSDEVVTALYKAHGAVLLRGFAMDLGGFKRFTDRFCASSVFNESPDRLLLDEAHNIQSVNGGADAFPLHPELSREPWKPDVCFFCCLDAPSVGGETTICDGVEIVRRLPAPVREGLDGRRLLYIQPASQETLEFWLGSAAPSDEQLAKPGEHCPYAFFRVKDRVVRAFTRPALHKPMFSDALAFGNFLLFARYYLGNQSFPALDNGRPVPPEWVEAVRATSEPITAPVAWQRGDLVMIDNSRFMHGRNAITDSRERLIASYFGYLRFALPNPEEPPAPLWRQTTFRPPEIRRAGTIGI